MVNMGIFVNMARPRNIPESKINDICLLLVLFELAGFGFFVAHIAKSIDDRKKGSWIDSSNTLLIGSVNGITAKRVDAVMAIVLLLYQYLAIRYTRAVSTNASVDMIIRGAKKIILIDSTLSTVGFRIWG